jgi:hypothetical protein
MVGGDRKMKTLGAVAIAVAVLAAVAGCASSSVDAASSVASDVTLAQSKSYAQLLRNEASSRLPPIVLKEVAQSSDVSVACDETSEDPDGLVRSWTSSMSILVTNSTASRIQKVADDLVASFVEQGWAADSEGSSTETLTVTELTSKASLASIEVATASKADGQAPAITITATGVCALTGGPDSDEVTKLEAQEPANAG